MLLPFYPTRDVVIIPDSVIKARGPGKPQKACRRADIRSMIIHADTRPWEGINQSLQMVTPAHFQTQDWQALVIWETAVVAVVA
jgi:hypothetical protein